MFKLNLSNSIIYYYPTGFIVANYALHLKAHPKKAAGEEEESNVSSKKSHYKSRDNHMSVTLEENRLDVIQDIFL